MNFQKDRYGNDLAVTDLANHTADASKGEFSPSYGIGCHKCETHCPQAIEISKELKNASYVVEVFLYKTGSWIDRRFTNF